jgi:hypothetical protein
MSAIAMPATHFRTLMIMADADPDAPWMRDQKLGGMSPRARKASWLGEQQKREIEQKVRLVVPPASWQPPTGPAEYGLPEESDAVDLQPANRQGAKHFTPVAIDDVQMSAESPWLIRGILPARGLACIVGSPKCGKSFLATDMLCAVARGIPYAGRETTAGAVLYLTGEGVVGFKHRLVALRRHHAIEGAGTPFYMIENVPDLGSERTDLPDLLAELDQFVQIHAPVGIKAVVLDTLARCMGQADENSARDMGRFVDRCSQIERRYGCVVVVVHHVGKDPGRGGRGSNALNGAADVTMLVEKVGSYSRVRIEEMKDGPTDQEWSFRLVPYQFAETTDTPAETGSETSTCVIEILSKPGEPKPSIPRAKKPPAGVAGDLLKVIRQAIAEAGATNVDSLAVPNTARAINRADLKGYCAKMAWQDQEEKPDAFRSMLSSNLSKLRSSDNIGFDKKWVWLR